MLIFLDLTIIIVLKHLFQSYLEMSRTQALSRYKKYLRVLEMWPLDSTKSEPRDLGALMRKRIDIEFYQGDQTHIDDVERCDKMLQSLENIASNKYKNMYKTEWNSASGLDFEKCQYAVSDECIDELRRMSDMSMIRRGFEHIKEFLPTRKEEQKKLT